MRVPWPRAATLAPLSKCAKIRTAIYAGGDICTANVLPDVKGTIDDANLGAAVRKDVIMIRSSRVKKGHINAYT